jgi:hypothetical protein
MSIITLIILILPLIGASDPVSPFKKVFYDKEIWGYTQTNLKFCIIPVNKWPLDTEHVGTSSFRPGKVKRHKELRDALDQSRIIKVKQDDAARTKLIM